MRLLHTLLLIATLQLPAFVSAHARIKYPRPLNYPTDTADGNYYNSPLKKDGSEFPCKNLHKEINFATVNKTTFKAGEKTYFEFVGQDPPGKEGALAAHSGGSCQASLSFDKGSTWKVLHSFMGGCPRGATKGSNIVNTPDQKFEFAIPVDALAGPALFAWSWIAISGNREEYYMNCAAVDIVGSGSSKLETFPDMFVGEMLLPPNINENECRTTEGFAMEYPNPGEFKTVENVPNIGFKKPTDGKCYAPGCNGANGDTPKSKDSASPSKTKTISSPLQTINVDLKSCKCVCSV